MTPIARRLALHVFEDAVYGSLLEIGQVHRHLSQAAHQKPRALNEAQPPLEKAHSFGNLLGDIDIGVFRKTL